MDHPTKLEYFGFYDDIESINEAIRRDIQAESVECLTNSSTDIDVENITTTPAEVILETNACYSTNHSTTNIDVENRKTTSYDTPSSTSE